MSTDQDGCIAMRGGGFRHSFITDGRCTYCGQFIQESDEETP